MKLYNFSDWNKRTIQLSEWDTDELMFKKEFAKIKKGSIVIDVGSEYGFYAIMAGQLVGSSGKVLAIEAHPETYCVLKMNIKLHKLTDRIIPICKAVSSETGKIKLFETISPGSTSIMPRRSPFKVDGKRVYTWLEIAKEYNIFTIIRKRFTPAQYIVPMDTLDNIIKEHRLEKINLIKVDVEGAELDVLKGSAMILEGYKPILLVELHFGLEQTPNTLYGLLKEFDYDLTIEERKIKSLFIARPR